MALHEWQRKVNEWFPADGTHLLGHTYFTKYGNKYSYQPVYQTFTWSKKIGYRDECYTMGHLGPPYRHGGPFLVLKYRDGNGDLRNTGHYQCDGVGTTDYHYEGGFVSQYTLNSLAASLNATVDGSVKADWYSSYAKGAEAWNKFAPGNSVADAAVFLAEMKDLPRMLQSTGRFFHNIWRDMGGSRTSFAPKHVADQFLNQQFGWVPFLSDMRKFYRAYRTLDDRIRRIRKYNSKWVKRGGTVSDEGESVALGGSETTTAHYPVLNSYFYTDPQISGSREIHLVKQTTEWFEGRFRYYIPDIETPEWERRVTRQLYGLTLSPSVLWEATPWSWLADWVSNAGDIIANLDAGWAENLAAKYAYVMGTRNYTWEVKSTHALKSGTLNASWSSDLIVKDRHGANPFGFGLTGGDLSPRQLGILTALGITRASI